MAEAGPYKPIVVLYEDDEYIAFNKPSGLLVIPTPRREKHTLMAIVNEQHVSSGNEGKLHPCHRLDRDTSGVILFAKGKRSQQRMMGEFKERKVEKKYLAFVQGKLKRPQGQLKSAIRDFNQRKFAKDSAAKWAVTGYKVIEVKRDYSVVEVYPVSGRTNQIRIQFSEIGHPLVGEDKYAFRKDFALRFKRTALHALSLAWLSPKRKTKITVTAPLSKDMEAFLAKN